MFRWSILLLSAGAIGLAACHGHVIRPEFAPNQGGSDFDFKRPPCAPGAHPAGGGPAPDTVLVRYLGAGGLFVQWGEDAFLTGPFFSNPGLLRVAFGRLKPREEAVEEGLRGVPLEAVRAILAGHSHYDHLGEIPLVASKIGGAARIYVNRSGVRMLAAYPDLAARSESLERHAGRWVRLNGPSGAPVPIRFMPVPSEHAPLIRDEEWAEGEVERPWSEPWTGHRAADFLGGQPFALVFDLLSRDGAEVRFRIYYQDAASGEGRGYPPPEASRETHPYDLAVLCMPSYHLVRNDPRALLTELRPRHVLAVHYEDLFRSVRKPLRFMATLTDRKANRFLEVVRSTLKETGQKTSGPAGGVCGPSSCGWTMPLPGEWMQFGPL